MPLIKLYYKVLFKIIKYKAQHLFQKHNMVQTNLQKNRINNNKLIMFKMLHYCYNLQKINKNYKNKKKLANQQRKYFQMKKINQIIYKVKI